MMVGAVDIGGTKIAVGIVDEDGRVLSKAEFPSNPGHYEKCFELVTTTLRQMTHDRSTEMSGIGIGSTGPVNPFTGEFGAVDFLPGWKGRNMVKDLQRTFNVQAAMENDADAAVLGEMAWGAGKYKSRLVYVTIGTGIGGGIVLNRCLYRGVCGAHPELGHQVIDPSGPLCSCGFRGCWESLAAGPAMVAWVEAQSPSNCPHGETLTAKRICEFAQEGEHWARVAVEREAHYLGLGLANLISVLTPDAIVLGGSVMKSASLFLDGVRREISSGCKFVPFEKTAIVLPSLGEDANLIGAAQVWHSRFGEGA